MASERPADGDSSSPCGECDSIPVVSIAVASEGGTGADDRCCGAEQPVVVVAEIENDAVSGGSGDEDVPCSGAAESAEIEGGAANRVEDGRGGGGEEGGGDSSPISNPNATALAAEALCRLGVCTSGMYCDPARARSVLVGGEHRLGCCTPEFDERASEACRAASRRLRFLSLHARGSSSDSSPDCEASWRFEAKDEWLRKPWPERNMDGPSGGAAALARRCRKSGSRALSLEQRDSISRSQ